MTEKAHEDRVRRFSGKPRCSSAATDMIITEGMLDDEACTACWVTMGAFGFGFILLIVLVVMMYIYFKPLEKVILEARMQRFPTNT